MSARAVHAARHEAAKIRVQRALDHLQEAQNLVGHASEDLSSVCFGAKRARAVVKLYAKVKAEWYRVNALLESKRIVLQADPSARDLDPTRGVRS